MAGVQIFGTKKSQATRAAERFFKERRVAIQFVDLDERPMAPAEIKRFVQRFGMTELIDRESKPFETLKYMIISESGWIAKIEREPKLLRLPLVRQGNLLSVGQDQEAWATMLTEKK